MQEVVLPCMCWLGKLGIPPEARNMVVLHDFTPCVDDELEVRRGSVVSILYRENDWVSLHASFFND